MLAMQVLVYTGTVSIDKVPAAERDSRHTSRSVKLARDEQAILLEADKALALLNEDGTSVAFPEAFRQIREDMLSVTRLLERAKVGELTQSIEEDIIEALEEIVEALQKEMEKSEEEKEQQQQDQNQQPQDPELVDKLAELKMLRSLQFRINRRTRRLGRLVEGEQANDPELLQQLRDLSRRQARLQKATYELATGRNR
jgi:predicted RNase H-like nuclease (RuvC/YqgF family)